MSIRPVYLSKNDIITLLDVDDNMIAETFLKNMQLNLFYTISSRIKI